MLKVGASRSLHGQLWRDATVCEIGQEGEKVARQLLERTGGVVPRSRPRATPPSRGPLTLVFLRGASNTR